MKLFSVTPEKPAAPEKLTPARAAAKRLDVLGTPQQVYQPGTVQAKADSVAAGIKARPSAAKGKSREEIVQGLLEKIAGWEAKLGATKLNPVTSDYDLPELSSERARKAYQDLIDNARRKIKKLSPETLIEEPLGSEGNPFPVKSEEELDALPEDCWFIGPDGVPRHKGVSQ